MSSPSAPEPIDAHVHLWRYAPAEHPWMTPAMGAIKRDFLPPELLSRMVENGVGWAMAVQAQHTLDETRWLLDLADAHPFLAGVVGWVPLTSPDVARDLDRFEEHPKLVGVRHVVLDDPDDALMLRDDFSRGVGMLAARGLAYDLIVYERHLEQALSLVDRHPDQVFVLDHLARPELAKAPSRAYRARLRELAERPRVYCKLSGLTTGAAFHDGTAGAASGPPDAVLDAVAPYVDVALEAFGPRRLMFGSDWPMCILTSDYGRWVDLVRRLTAKLSKDEQAWLWRKTAEEAYGISPPGEATWLR